MTATVLFYIVLILTVVLLLNLAALRFWRTLHPGTFRAFVGLTVLGNLFWLYVPFIIRDRLSSVGRVLRATLGPIWFAWLGVVLIYVSVMLLVVLAWLIAGRRRPFASFGRPVSIVVSLLIVLIGAIGFYHALVPLRVERVPVVIEGLPPDLSGFRIGLMSDVHVGLFTRPSRLQRFATEINSVRPDIVLLSGDLIDDDPFFVPKLLSGISLIDSSIPVFGVLGNHEIYGDPNQFIEQLKGSRIDLLVNRGLPIRRGASSVWLAGVSDYAAGGRQFPELVPDLDAALEGREPEMTTVVLSHQPKVFDEAVARTIPLTLCGHTHGGQMGIRPLGWSLAGLFLPYHMGLYRRGGSQLYVNTGTGFWLVPFRFGMTPEITIIELVAGGSTSPMGLNGGNNREDRLRPISNRRNSVLPSMRERNIDPRGAVCHNDFRENDFQLTENTRLISQAQGQSDPQKSLGRQDQTAAERTRKRDQRIHLRVRLRQRAHTEDSRRRLQPLRRSRRYHRARKTG